MSLYTFDTILLSAQKLGSPEPVTGTHSLSANGVNTISLSVQDTGIAFNKKDDLSGVLINCTVEGNLFRIDRIYDGSQMVLVKGATPATYGVGTIFQFASGGTFGVSLSSNYRSRSFTTPETRRKWVYGYR
jgi:hypothetical protein